VEKNIIAEELGKEMKEISVAEFFEKNKHFLGYENPTKSLATVVKESVDNSLDACDEAGILPRIFVSVKQVGSDRFRVITEDNGPGIVKEKIPLAFGKLLFGSKFHRLKQNRGIMGVGISGSILYSQLTTGKSTKISSSTGADIHELELMIDVTKNEPKIVSSKKIKNSEGWHGIKIEMEVEGRYIEKGQSILRYLKQVAISNPHANVIYDGPSGKVKFKRVVKKSPEKSKSIKPHPYGVELGIFRRMLSATKTRNVLGFLTTDFTRVGKKSAEKICRLAKIEFSRNPKKLTAEESDRLHKAMQMVKLRGPPTNCLSPLKEDLITGGLKKELDAETYIATIRNPTVYRGYPFQVSIGLAYGGNLSPNLPCKLLRFANKVPLLYNKSSCAITRAIIETDWRRYGVSQSQGQLPIGPLAILVHFASVWIPFTSEGKQAIANYPEIVKEIKLALQGAGRKLAKFVREKKKAKERFLRKRLFERYIPEVAESLAKLTDKEKKKILNKLEEFVRGGVKRK
jgi:DNA topoisomerase-6 subunit B